MGSRVGISLLSIGVFFVVVFAFVVVVFADVTSGFLVGFTLEPQFLTFDAKSQTNNRGLKRSLD